MTKGLQWSVVLLFLSTTNKFQYWHFSRVYRWKNCTE